MQNSKVDTETECDHCEVETTNLQQLYDTGTITRRLNLCVPCYQKEQYRRIGKLKKGRFHWCGTLGTIVDTPQGKMTVCPLCHGDLIQLANTDRFIGTLKRREREVRKYWKMSNEDLSEYRRLLKKNVAD